MNSYFSNIVGATFRDYFNSKSATTTINFAATSPATSATGYSSFRDLYRRVYNNEMIYKLYDYTGSGTTLASTAGTFGFAGSLLEIRKFGNSSTAGTIILSAIRTYDSGTDTINVPVYAGVANTYYNAITISGSSTKYSKVNAVSVIGFNSAAGSTFEIWVR